MENKNKSIKASFSKILLAVTAILLFAASTVQAITFDGGATYEVTGTINENVLIKDNGTIVNFNASVPYPYSVYVYAGSTLNFDDNAYAYYIYASDGSFVNLYDGTVDWKISVSAGANIKIYGSYVSHTNDSSNPDAHYDATSKKFLVNYPINPNGWNGTLTCKYEGASSNSSIPFSTFADIAFAGGPIEVEIDIKPGSYPNSINLGSNGVVPVAILSTADFVATDITSDNVFLAGAGVAVRGKGNNLAHEEDVNGDGIMDLVVKVETENLDPGTFQDGWAVLRIHETWEQTSPVLYEGWDEITIVPPE